MILKICYFTFLFSVMLKAEDYCQSETFAPSCLSDEVILITKAHYGRMKFGKCVKEEQQLKIIWNDPQYLGCSTDVISFVSKHCTGKRNCQLKVSDPELEKYGSCYASLKMYLDVSYTCIKVAQNNRQCAITLDSYGDIHVMKQHQEEGCGTKGQPWIVETMKGQTISVHSIKYLKSPEGEPTILAQQRLTCPEDMVEGYILDKSVNKNITLCSSQRDSYQYNSTSNVIEIVFFQKTEGSPLFLNLRAAGCSDLIPPADAWLKRTENEATIGCYSTRLRWQLKCVGQRWIGVIGNCSYVMDHIPETTKKKHSLNPENLGHNNQMFTVTVICACGIILCSLIVCIGIICLRRYSNRSKIVESILKEKIVTANGSLMKASNPHQAAYSHYYDEEVEKVPNGVSQVQGDYFVLDKDVVSNQAEKPSDLFGN